MRAFFRTFGVAAAFVLVAAAAFATVAVLAQTQPRPGAPGAGTQQPRPTTPTTTAPPQTRPAANPGNIAIIDSGAFADEKAGIARVTSAMKQIEAKYDPIRNEIRQMRERLNTMRSDLQKKQAIQEAKITAQQADEADRLDVQIKRKTEDAQAGYQKESLAVLDPLQKDIADSLTAYAQAKGISLLFDVSRVPVIYAASNLDITSDFIREYNRTHPATGAARP
jgi:outer membrane protein